MIKNSIQQDRLGYGEGVDRVVVLVVVSAGRIRSCYTKATMQHTVTHAHTRLHKYEAYTTKACHYYETNHE